LFRLPGKFGAQIKSRGANHGKWSAQFVRYSGNKIHLHFRKFFRAAREPDQRHYRHNQQRQQTRGEKKITTTRTFNDVF
jgi:hypothetical protein